jgi:hypothetical protein
MDLIGPWTLNIQGAEVKLNALTCIDPIYNLVEISRIQNESAAHVGMIFKNRWVARYPRPLHCSIHDNGGEFNEAEFQQVLESNGIKDIPTTVKNPQSNTICKRKSCLKRYNPIFLFGTKRCLDLASESISNRSDQIYRGCKNIDDPSIASTISALIVLSL